MFHLGWEVDVRCHTRQRTQPRIVEESVGVDTTLVLNEAGKQHSKILCIVVHVFWVPAMIPMACVFTDAAEPEVDPHRCPHTPVLPQHDIAPVHVSVHEAYLLL